MSKHKGATDGSGRCDLLVGGLRGLKLRKRDLDYKIHPRRSVKSLSPLLHDK